MPNSGSWKSQCSFRTSHLQSWWKSSLRRTPQTHSPFLHFHFKHTHSSHHSFHSIPRIKGWGIDHVPVLAIPLQPTSSTYCYCRWTLHCQRKDNADSPYSPLQPNWNRTTNQCQLGSNSERSNPLDGMPTLHIHSTGNWQNQWWRSAVWMLPPFIHFLCNGNCCSLSPSFSRSPEWTHQRTKGCCPNNYSTIQYALVSHAQSLYSRDASNSCAHRIQLLLTHDLQRMDIPQPVTPNPQRLKRFEWIERERL